MSNRVEIQGTKERNTKLNRIRILGYQWGSDGNDFHEADFRFLTNWNNPTDAVESGQCGSYLFSQQSIYGTTNQAHQYYVWNLIQDELKLLEIEFVKSDDNKADTFTKNMNGMLFKKHAEMYMNEEVDEQQKGGC